MAGLIDRSNTTARMKRALMLDPSACAVLTIDCQRGNLEPGLASLPVPETECSRVVAGTNRLLSLARSTGIAVIHATTVWEAPLQASHPFERAMLELKESFTPHAKSDFAHHKSPGSAGSEFVPGLDVRDTDLVVDSKRTFDAFYGTPLEQMLRAMKVGTLLVAGCNTNTCVLSTVFGGYNRGLRMVVVAECVASAYGSDMHEFALANIERRLGWVLTFDELADKLAAPHASRAARGK
jgi:nicotinamidase-related amidase